MDWLNALDPPQAMANVYADILGDWYRDPWSWPELRWVVEKAPDRLASRLNETGARRVVLMDVPKENFVIRPAILLDPLDRLAYQAIVDRLSAPIVGKLREWAYGWRLDRENPTGGKYMKNATEWSHYRHRLKFLAGAMPCGLTTDIVSFFASVDINRLLEDLLATARSPEIVARLSNFLHDLQAYPTRAGLPQRCWASSVLAHFYLLPLDDLLAAEAPTLADSEPGTPGVTRWMDDIWVFADSQMPLRLLELEIQDLLRQRGLNMNAARTTVYEGDALQQQAQELEHSAIDAALGDQPPDDTPLRELVVALLETPEIASRTSLRFATTRIRQQAAFDLVGDFVDLAFRLPHASDHIARLFRDSQAWRDLSDWYIAQSRLYSSALTWSLYHLGTMFPSEEAPSEELSQYWADSLAEGATALLMVPLVAQRLAAWDADSARPVFRAAITRSAYQHPFAMRALALAGRAAGMTSTEVRRILGQFAETELTVRYLESRSMKPPKPSVDFAGS